MPDEFVFVEFVFEEFDEFVSMEFEPFVFVEYMLCDFVFDGFVFVVVLLSPELFPRMRGVRRLLNRNMNMKIKLIRFNINIYLAGMRGARRVRRLDLNLLLAKQ